MNGQWLHFLTVDINLIKLNKNGQLSNDFWKVDELLRQYQGYVFSRRLMSRLGTKVRDLGRGVTKLSFELFSLYAIYSTFHNFQESFA